MSEDEKIIEDIKEIINRCKECKFATCEQCEINWTQIKTIEHLLDLYNKEKEKNKELEKYRKYYETEKVVWSRKDYISKDKIKEKIKELESILYRLEDDLSMDANKYDTINELNIQIDILEELLEERN